MQGSIARSGLPFTLEHLVPPRPNQVLVEQIAHLLNPSRVLFHGGFLVVNTLAAIGANGAFDAHGAQRPEAKRSLEREVQQSRLTYPGLPDTTRAPHGEQVATTYAGTPGTGAVPTLGVDRVSASTCLRAWAGSFTHVR